MLLRRRSHSSFLHRLVVAGSRHSATGVGWGRAAVGSTTTTTTTQQQQIRPCQQRLVRHLSSEPFYGAPRPKRNTSCNNRISSSSSLQSLVPSALETMAQTLDLVHRTLLEPNHNHANHHHHSTRAAVTLHQAAIALRDPTRADAVAAVGELTGVVALQQLQHELRRSEAGRQLLQERPVVSKETIPYDDLWHQAAVTKQLPYEELTLGQAYGRFLATHGFDPDERDPIRYLTTNTDNPMDNNGSNDTDTVDDELAYIMLRYRQSHDYYHAVTGLPPTVLGELALKVLELFQTGLPSAALAALGGGLTHLNGNEQQQLWHTYVPWAQRVGREQLPFGALLTVHYEDEFDTPLVELHRRMGSTELFAPRLPEGPR